MMHSGLSRKTTLHVRLIFSESTHIDTGTGQIDTSDFKAYIPWPIYEGQHAPSWGEESPGCLWMYVHMHAWMHRSLWCVVTHLSACLYMCSFTPETISVSVQLNSAESEILQRQNVIMIYYYGWGRGLKVKDPLSSSRTSSLADTRDFWLNIIILWCCFYKTYKLTSVSHKPNHMDML